MKIIFKQGFLEYQRATIYLHEILATNIFIIFDTRMLWSLFYVLNEMIDYGFKVCTHVMLFMSALLDKILSQNDILQKEQIIFFSEVLGNGSQRIKLDLEHV